MKQHYAPALNRCRKKETLFQINWQAGLSAARVIRFTKRPSCGGARLHLQGKCSIINKVKTGRKEGTQRAGTKREKSPGRWLDGPARL